ncbi:hypothetical protein [Methanosphaera cuniculi]|uniref:Uncharacterized protein n=1 Tax=Methanosphaera cuniculi TaxID=1077256 RepID=A0A2A2HE53_9EURY|nr:hypothetical protein [Methanosphaera cuniculi]PAV07608.1 hypothetical protein ASJ82_08000 [Methanosphaera cuniculi]PWL08068.1 hypothetical protein MSCUN_09990 [Methanosphaera cuniculi]
MVGYSDMKLDMELYLRRRINKEYPILFNRVNWQVLEENMDNLVEFQKQHERILPLNFRPNLVENDPKGIYELFSKKIIEAIFSRKSNYWQVYRHDPNSGYYDDVYEFIQEFPEWSKLVYYDEDPYNPYDDILTIQYKDYPILFNRFNWQYISQNIRKLYQLTLNEKKPVIPPILFMYDICIKNMSENYKNISDKIYEYYESEEEKGNEYFKNWDKKYDYDSVYEFIMTYPEFKDIVYFDPDK